MLVHSGVSGVELQLAVALSWNSMGPTRTRTPTPTRTLARGSSRGCPLGMRACTRVNVYCTREAIVYTFTKLHDRRIANVGVGVRVGVGLVEFKLCADNGDRQLPQVHDGTVQ